MQENLLPQVADFKLYKRKMITISTFFAGPLIGGYLLAENFIQLGEKEKAKRTWLYTILSLLIIFATIFIPGFEQIPSIVFPIIYTSIIVYFVQRYQESKLKVHEENGGQFYSAWRVVLGSLISIIIFFAIVFGLLVIADPNILTV